MRWYKQTVYIQRNDAGVVVRISETKPADYKSIYEERREKAYRATENAEKQITEYAKRKIEEKKLRMGELTRKAEK